MLIAEVGLDMTVFPAAGHLASWAGICPGNNSSGGKHRPGRTRHGSMWLRIVLTEVTHVAARGKGTYPAAHHAQIRGRRGTQKAIGATLTRHDILIASYHIVHDNVPNQDLDRTGTTAAGPPSNKPDDSWPPTAALRWLVSVGPRSPGCWAWASLVAGRLQTALG